MLRWAVADASWASLPLDDGARQLLLDELRAKCGQEPLLLLAMEVARRCLQHDPARRLSARRALRWLEAGSLTVGQ